MVQTHSSGVGLIAYTFHFCIMWFFFRAGIYFKDEYSTNISQTIKFAAKKYLLPYSILSLISLIIDICFFQNIEERTLIQSIECTIINFVSRGAPYSNIPISFFLALFLAHISFRYLAKYKIFGAALLLPVLDWILKNEDVNLPLGLHYVLYGLFYYTCGFLYQKYNFLKSIFAKFVSIITYTYFILKEPQAIGANSELTLHGNIMNYLCTLSAIATYRAIMSWTPYIKERYVPDSCGTIAFCIHWPIIIISRMILSKEEFCSISTTIGLIIGTIFIAFIIDYAMQTIMNRNKTSKGN